MNIDQHPESRDDPEDEAGTIIRRMKVRDDISWHFVQLRIKDLKKRDLMVGRSIRSSTEDKNLYDITEMIAKHETILGILRHDMQRDQARLDILNEKISQLPFFPEIFGPSPV